jgi:hypothetical protein
MTVRRGSFSHSLPTSSSFSHDHRVLPDPLPQLKCNWKKVCINFTSSIFIAYSACSQKPIKDNHYIGTVERIALQEARINNLVSESAASEDIKLITFTSNLTNGKSCIAAHLQPVLPISHVSATFRHSVP